MTPEVAQHAVEIGDELLKNLSLIMLCEPSRRYPEVLEALAEELTEIQQRIHREHGISLSDSGKVIMSCGLAGWACEVSKARLKNQ